MSEQPDWVRATDYDKLRDERDGALQQRDEAMAVCTELFEVNQLLDASIRVCGIINEFTNMMRDERDEARNDAHDLQELVERASTMMLAMRSALYRHLEEWPDELNGAEFDDILDKACALREALADANVDGCGWKPKAEDALALLREVVDKRGRGGLDWIKWLARARTLLEDGAES